MPILRLRQLPTFLACALSSTCALSALLQNIDCLSQAHALVMFAGWFALNAAAAGARVAAFEGEAQPPGRLPLLRGFQSLLLTPCC